jgi:RNA polymerase sigma factor (sigma-70 family)
MANFEELISTELSKLRSLAAYLLPNGNAVDDVVQLTVIRAHEQWQQRKDDLELGPWLRTILRYMVMTQLKQMKREGENRHNYRSQWFELLEQGMEPCRENEDQREIDIQESLSQCREKLSPTAQELIQLKYDEHMSCKDIASQKSKSTSWVTTTLSRVRQTLKQCIQSRQNEEKS